MKEFPVYERRVQFCDTDMARIVHFSKVLCMVEEAEHALLHDIGVPAVDRDGGFPKVHVEIDYRSPLRYRDIAAIHFRLLEVGSKSLSYGFRVYVGERLAAEGRITTVLIDMEGKSRVISDEWRQTLSEYVADWEDVGQLGA
ncbi:1,4-dihydroxy-2-naphthoyl-CoA hydrolase [Rubritalea halochordaticola]|uniref:1,4-dihydroxy-2-naphthoyl-CoA hydrolase n=1 Tax=Rubritalea halochordaticola TaxID=714537 RepID=A0ABP9UZW8_9BACT